MEPMPNSGHGGCGFGSHGTGDDGDYEVPKIESDAWKHGESLGILVS